MSSFVSIEWPSPLVLVSTILFSAFSVIISIELKKLYYFRQYGIPVAHHEWQEKATPYWRKMLSLCIMAFLEIGEIVSGGNVSHSALLISSVALPLTMAMTYAKFNYKLSMAPSNSAYSNCIQPAMLFLAAILKFGQELAWGADWAGDLKYLLLRLITLAVFVYEPIPPLPPKIKDKEKGNEEPAKVVANGLFATIAKFYPLRDYLLPTSARGRFYGIVFIIVTLVGSVSSFYQNMYSMKIVNSLQLDTGNSSNATGETSIVDQLGSARLEFRWDFILIYYGIRFFDSSVLWVFKYYVQEQTEAESCSKLQLAIFSKLQNLSLRWHLENQASEIFTMMVASPYILEDIINTCSWLIPETVNMAVAVLYMLRFYNFKLSSVVILTGVLSGMIDYFVIRRRDRALEEMKEAESNVRTSRSATFENYETMKYFTNEEYERKKYEKVYFEDKDKQISEFIYSHTFHGTRDLIRVGAETIVILIVVKAVLGGAEGLTAGDYLYFSGVFSSILWPVDSFISFFKRLQDNAIDVEKISAVLDLVPEITDEPDAQDLEIDETGGSIEFKNVCFSYVPERQVMKDLSFFIPAGHTVAFVGRSGSGKSTLTKLIFRFYDPTSGEILVNGQSIRKLKCISLRRAISVVPQDVVLFPESIKYNIQYGRIDASDEEIEDAAKAAWLHDRINSFPEKYETEVGNRGFKLSGGEKQRVAIARAILRNPPILLLDEATSSLDTETEKQIQASLESLCENRTTIIIAHRLSTIVNANTIFVLDEGSIIESGSHEELLLEDGVYASMWNQQFLNGSSRVPSDTDE